MTPQGRLRLRALAMACELSEFAAQRLDLRCPVQPQLPPKIGRSEPGRALCPGLPQQRHEKRHQQRHPQPIEACAHRAVDVRGDRQQTGHLQRRHAKQQPSKGQLRALSDHHRRLGQVPEPRGHPLRGPSGRRRQHHQTSNPTSTVLRAYAGHILDAVVVLIQEGST